MNQAEQSVLIAAQTKLRDTLTPKSGNVGIQLEGPNRIGKTVAMSEYVKRKGRPGRTTQDFMKSKTSLPSEPPVRCIRMVRRVVRTLGIIAIVIVPTLLSQLWPLQYWSIIACLVAAGLIYGAWVLAK